VGTYVVAPVNGGIAVADNALAGTGLKVADLVIFEGIEAVEEVILYDLVVFRVAADGELWEAVVRDSVPISMPGSCRERTEEDTAMQIARMARVKGLNMLFCLRLM
jgi:hypothetical protein